MAHSDLRGHGGRPRSRRLAWAICNCGCFTPLRAHSLDIPTPVFRQMSTDWGAALRCYARRISIGDRDAMGQGRCFAAIAEAAAAPIAAGAPTETEAAGARQELRTCDVDHFLRALGQHAHRLVIDEMQLSALTRMVRVTCSTLHNGLQRSLAWKLFLVQAREVWKLPACAAYLSEGIFLQRIRCSLQLAPDLL